MARKFPIKLGKERGAVLQVVTRTLDTSFYRRKPNSARNLQKFCDSFPADLLLPTHEALVTRNDEGDYQLAILFTPAHTFCITFDNSSAFKARVNYSTREKNDMVKNTTKGTTKIEKVLSMLTNYASGEVGSRVRVRRTAQKNNTASTHQE